MDVVGSEIGQKMRSAIKAKLTELGCYVDDELPDYVMVMVANKRTRSQMEDDLQLFLGDNTELFVNWLHQVLKKLQEVTVATPMKSLESDKIKERSLSKERKIKDKKEKSKKSDGTKKSKKKAKEKTHTKKDEKKKSKKKSKHEMIRPNIPPLLMNIEKESEPSITDVFAGQILKNHGIVLETHEPKIVETKPVIPDIIRPVIPIIDPAGIPSQTHTSDVQETNTRESTDDDFAVTNSEIIVASRATETITSEPREAVSSTKSSDPVIVTKDNATRESKIREMKEIEAKIYGLKQKLTNQLDSQNDSPSDDEDFLNIRTEADELINDFAEDVYQEISQPPPVATPPIRPRQSRSPSPPPPVPKVGPKSRKIPETLPNTETLPQIELNLPKRPIRERLGAVIQKKDAVVEKNKVKASEKLEMTPERYTPEKEPETRSQKSAKSRLGSHSETQRKKSISDDNVGSENRESKRLTSRVSVLESRTSRMTCASVVRVRPRPRVSTPASSLLLRAVADAHKSLLNIPPKVEPEPQKVKRALVLPMRRAVDPKKIVIQVPCNESPIINSTDSISDNVSLGDLESDGEDGSPMMPADTNREEYTPIALTKISKNNEYVCSRTLFRRDDTQFVDTINIHNTAVDKDRDTQFIVTMDGYHPNAFLAKKLMTEGLLNDDEEQKSKASVSKETPNNSEELLGNNSNNGIKDIAILSDTKTATSITTGHVQHIEIKSDEDGKRTVMEKGKIYCLLEDVLEKHEKEVSKTKPIDEKIKSDAFVGNSTDDIPKRENSTENQIVECSKTNVTTDNVVTENTKSDVSSDKPTLEKRKCDIPTDKPTLEKRKSAISTDKPTLEKRISDISTDKPTLEKRKSYISTEKPTLEKRKGDISTNKPILEKRKGELSPPKPILEKRKSDVSLDSSASEYDTKNTPPVKRRKASPIIFDIPKKEKVADRVRERTISVNSDSHIVLTTSSNTHKYDTVPPLSQASKPVWCRAFPQCRYGATCAFAHPRCKFAAACTRRGCAYSHAPNALSPTALTSAPLVASHVVPAANYKTISAGAFANLCKFYPSCSNPACHYYHPKPCRYGKACTNKLECNFYHHDVPGGKWKYSV